MDIYNIIFYRFIDVFFSLRWMWVIAIILVYKLGKRYLDPNYRYLKIKENEELNKNKDRSKSIKLNETVANKNKNKKLYLC